MAGLLTYGGIGGQQLIGNGTGTAGGIYTGNGSLSYGQQPGGNVYPAGISGVGPNNSGSTVGTVQQQQLVANQLRGLLDENSPYIQQARQQALNQANSRGILNGSMAAGNAEGAAIQAALPIATNDANTYSNLQTTNLNNLNRVLTSQIGAAAQVDSASAYAGGQMAAAEINAQNALQRQREDLAYMGEQAGLNRAFQFGENQQQYENSLGLSGFNFANQSALSSQQFGQTGALAAEQYGFNSALSGQQYQQNLRLGEFNLGGSLLQNQQNFFDQAGIAGLSNPALIGDPSAFGGYMQFIQGMMGPTIDNIFNNVLGGGQGGGYGH